MSAPRNPRNCVVFVRTIGADCEQCGHLLRSCSWALNAPLPPVQASHRGSIEDSPLDGGHDDEGHDPELDSEPEDSEEPRDEVYRVKTEMIQNGE